MKHASILAMVLTATAAIALADIAPEPLITGGATLTPRNAKDLTVALTEEVVDLTPSPQRNTVTAVFTLKNTGDKPATLDVGFVNFYGEVLKDTAVEIDGKKQLAEVTRETLPSGPYKTITKCWLTWPMTFDKGQTRTVKVSYWVEMGRTRLITMTQLPKDVNDQVAPCCSGFVLRTGAAWLGNTSKGTFRLHYSDQVKKLLLTIQSPKDGWKYDEASNTDTLTLADFKPASAFGLGFGGGRQNPSPLAAAVALGAGGQGNAKTPVTDISYTFKVCDDAHTVAALEEALKAKKLDVWATDYLLNMVEKDNVLKLSNDDRTNVRHANPRRRAAAQRPEQAADDARTEAPIDWKTVLTPGAEMKLHEYYGRLMAYYKQADKGKVLELAKYYQAFLKVIVDREGPNYNDLTKKHWPVLEQRFRQTEADYKDVSDFLATGSRY